MYYNMPLFSFNVKVWRFLSFIEFDNYNKTGGFLVFQLLLALSEFSNLFYNLNDLSVLTLSLFMFVINLNSIVRIMIVMKHQWKFIAFMEFIEDWYTELEMEEDAGAWKILKHLPRRNRLISTFGVAFGSFGGVATVLFPLIYEERRLPYDVSIPGFDSLKSPLYEIIYASQTFVAMPFIVLTYIPFTNLFICWLTFGISLLQILRHKLENLPHHNDQDMLRQLKDLIKFHHKIVRESATLCHIKSPSLIAYTLGPFGSIVFYSFPNYRIYGKTLEDLVSFVSLVELLLFTMMLVVLPTCFLLMHNIMFKIASAIYTLCILYALFISYWHTNEFSSESQKVADAAYNINWTQSNLAVRKCIMILMLRCQTTLKIRAGGVVPMTLETFQSLLNASYSYFTMLRGMMAK